MVLVRKRKPAILGVRTTRPRPTVLAAGLVATGVTLPVGLGLLIVELIL